MSGSSFKRMLDDPEGMARLRADAPHGFARTVRLSSEELTVDAAPLPGGLVWVRDVHGHIETCSMRDFSEYDRHRVVGGARFHVIVDREYASDGSVRATSRMVFDCEE